MLKKGVSSKEVLLYSMEMSAFQQSYSRLKPPTHTNTFTLEGLTMCRVVQLMKPGLDEILFQEMYLMFHIHK